MKIIDLKKLKLPDTPGVYFFLKGSKILYIGKATSLCDRTKSYFSKDLISTRGPLILDMVFKADSVKWQTTDSVLEALILEAHLIKKHKPYYNTKEKDDKSFNYVCITRPARNAFSTADAGGEKLPKVVVVRGRNIDNAAYKNTFGPYTSGIQLKEALKIIRKIFPYLDDKSKNYLEFYKQINLVPDLNDKKLYLQNIKNLKLFFQGKKKQILRNLKKEMGEYAKGREFEKAGEIKRQMFALQHINDVALIKNDTRAQKNFEPVTLPEVSGGTLVRQNFSAPGYRIEAYDIAHMSGKNMVGVMTVVEDGEVDKSKYRKFKIHTQSGANDTGALTEVLERRLAHAEWQYPSLIVVDGGVGQLNTFNKILKKLGVDIPLVSVLKDERHRAKDILVDPRQGGASKNIARKYEREILLANSEAHRFAIAYHKNMRGRNFLK